MISWQMVPEFDSVIFKTGKVGKLEGPVKTQFGWHSIQLEDTREAQFPPFDGVKPQIQERLAQMKLQKFQEDLRAAAKTDYKFAGQ